MFDKHSADVTKATNGKEAVEIWKNSKEGTFELILLDLRMPVMTGTEAAKEIRNSKLSIFVFESSFRYSLDESDNLYTPGSVS